MADEFTFRMSYGLAHLAFGENSKEIFRVHSDGRVELGPGVTVDEAARAFWDAVEREGFRRSRDKSPPNG